MTYLMSYGRRLTSLAACHPDRVAIVFVPEHGEERQVTWLELEQSANRVARLLAIRGLARGSLAAISLPNSLEHVVACYGAWKLGATVMPMRWSLPAWERDRLLDLADPAIVVTDDELDARWARVTRRELEGADRLDSSPLADCTAEPAKVIASSGSTGSPKLIVTPVPGVVDIEAPPNMAAITGDHIVQLVTSPLYHTNGFGCHLRLMDGGRVVLMERFDAARVVQLIERHAVNHVVLVPTMLQRIARLPDIDPRSLSTLRYVYYGGAPLAPWVARRWLELVGPTNFYFQYGGTEGMGGTMARGDEWLDHEGTVGRPLGCEVRIQGDGGEVLGPGEVGDIYFRPNATWTGFAYVGAPMPPRTDDGFTTYGDLGWLDAAGYLYIADRRVDMVISGGSNVFPAEVEAALSEHPAVADAVVIGLPDPEWGKRVHAIVQLAVGTTVGEDELRTHCRDRLAAYKVPKSFELVDALPRTEAGKLNRSAFVAEREVPA